MTEYVDTCHKLTFSLCGLEGLWLYQNILIHLQIYKLTQNQANSSLLSTELQAEHHSFENSLVADIYDCAYKIKAKGKMALSQNVFYLII